MNFHAWENELLNDPDSFFILDGLRNGFKRLSESDTLCIDSYANDNYSSATCAEFKPEMDQLFLNELALGRISRVQLSRSAFILSAAFLKKTRVNPARSHIVADHLECP